MSPREYNFTQFFPMSPPEYNFTQSTFFKIGKQKLNIIEGIYLFGNMATHLVDVRVMT